MGWLKKYFKKNPFLLAHHPSCDNFSGHTFDFRGWRLCLGCFVVYPTAIAALTVLILISQYISFSHQIMFYLALIFFGINLIRKFGLKADLGLRPQAIFRALIGISLAFMLTAVWLSSENTRLFYIFMLLAVAIGYNAFNGKKYLGTCKTCPQYHKFPKCEGLT